MKVSVFYEVSRYVQYKSIDKSKNDGNNVHYVKLTDQLLFKLDIQKLD